MSKQSHYDKVDILGVSVDVMSPSEAVEEIIELASPGKPAVYVTKPYVEFLDGAAHNNELTQLLNESALTIADGIAVVWAAHYLYAGPRSGKRFLSTLASIAVAPARIKWPIPERAGGTNFTWPLLEAAAEAGLRVALVGKQDPTEIEHTAQAILAKVPTLKIVLAHSGYDASARPGSVSARWTQQLGSTISENGADLVLLGMGFPLQERVCAELARRLTHGVLIGEGGTFDYAEFGGTRAKAPAIMQRLGLEWLWRLMLEPKRITRQLAIPRFLWRIWRSR